jgi:isocitrate/isopropylmalate dehydrogenase
MAAILTLAMLLETIGAKDAARAVEGAVRAAIAEGVGTSDIGGRLGTRAVGDWIAQKLETSTRH